MSGHTYRWAPIGAHSPEAAAAASLAAGGLELELALRLAPIAAAIDDIDHATPVNPAWPGILITEDDSLATIDDKRLGPVPAFVLELHADPAATKGGRR